MKIYFKATEEVICFCENLFKNYKQLDLIWHKDESYGNKINFVNVKRTRQLNEAITGSLTKVFSQHYLAKIMEAILKKNFYYTNQIEINRILQHAYPFIYDQYNDHLISELREPLESKFIKILLTEESLNLQSICHFQLKDLKKRLIDFVGLAIDDYKQEEEYQQFINNIRVFFKRKKPLLEELHILHDKNLFFFNKIGEEIRDLELEKLLEKEPLYVIGLSSSDLTLAPIISLAPSKIFIYSDNTFDGVIKTILNVCEERVSLKSLAHFPFPYSESKNIYKK